jgi:hypothetical protein
MEIAKYNGVISEAAKRRVCFSYRKIVPSIPIPPRSPKFLPFLVSFCTDHLPPHLVTCYIFFESSPEANIWYTRHQRVVSLVMDRAYRIEEGTGNSI